MSRLAPPAWLRDLAARVDQIRPEMLTSVRPPPEGGRASAVLILFGPEGSGGVDVLLTQRADGMRSHPGQVAFPGGSADPTDMDPADTALREAVEETGIDRAGVDVLGGLPALYLPPSKFSVTPILAWWAVPSPATALDPIEVARVARVSLAELLDPVNRFSVRHPSGYVGPGFAAQGLFIWGFTAGLLSNVLDQAGLTRPWDASTMVDLPEDQP